MGTAAWRGGGGKMRQENKKGKVRKTPAGKEKCGGRGSVTTTTDSTMSSDIWAAQSLCRRGGPGEDRAQQRGGEEERKREREACAALLWGHLRMHRACPCTCSSCDACCLLR